MKVIFSLLSIVGVAFGAGALHNFLPNFLYPPVQGGAGTRNPSACLFNGPTDAQTLRGQNFIENFATGSCLTLKKNGANNLPIEMGICTWNSIPTSNQLFYLRNGNGGSIIKPTVSGVFGADTCMTTNNYGGQLYGEKCSASGKDNSQTWRFNKIRENVYQITQLSNSKCLRVDSTRVGATPTVVRCNAFDNFQLWRICTSK